MSDILRQFSHLKVSRFEIVLQSEGEAVLPALLGSALRGAFGHALKAISCCVPHQNCGVCFLSGVCNYTTIFEPNSDSKLKDIPRPFIFEPPVPPLTREISEHQTLKIRVPKKGKISFGLVLLGETIGKLPYFIYAFELMARHGFGVNRQPFSVSEVFQIDAKDVKNSIYTPYLEKILPFEQTDLSELVEKRIETFNSTNLLKIHLQTPLRIRRNKSLFGTIDFNEFFKRCSLRLKFLAENYGRPLEYDYQKLMKKAGEIKTVSARIWEHESSRRSNRQDKKLEMDGLLGELCYGGSDCSLFLPFITASEILHIGSASSLGLGKFKIV